MRAVGLDPAGVVTASVLSWPFPYRYPQALVGRGRIQTGFPGPSGLAPQVPDDSLSAKRAGGFLRDYETNTTGGLLGGMGFSWQRVVYEYQQHQLFDAVIDQLRSEAEGLAAHGIMAVKVEWVRRPRLDYRELHVTEVKATGVAVRSGATRPPTPIFTATASGAEMAQLLRTGLAPSEAVAGIGVVRADLGKSGRAQLRSLGSGEVEQYSEAVQKSLSIAFKDIERRASPHGDLVVGCEPHISFERIVGAGVQTCTWVTGTAVRHFAAPEEQNPIQIMPLR